MSVCEAHTYVVKASTHVRILQSSPIKEGTRYLRFKFTRTATVSYSTCHRNSANDSK